MKFLIILFFTLTIFSFCSKKKAIGVQTQLSHNLVKKDSQIVNKDTTKKDTINFKSIDLEAKKIQALVLIKDLILETKIDFNTFSSEIKTQYSDNTKELNFNIFLRMSKDSLIWLSIEVFGFEVFRVKIDKKEIIILDKFSKNAKILNYKMVESLVGFPLDFNILQNIILGNYIEFNNNYLDIFKQENKISFYNSNSFIKSLVTYIIDIKELSSNLLTIDNGNISCDIYLSNYKTIEDKIKNIKFSFNRNIIIKGKVQSIINLNFHNIKLNEKLSYPFSIPKNYSISTTP